MFTTRPAKSCGNDQPLEEPAEHDQVGVGLPAMVEDRPAEVFLPGRRLGKGLPIGPRRSGIFASRANCSPRAVGLLDTTAAISTGNSPAAIFSIKLRSVVPPPEIRTAMRKGVDGIGRKSDCSIRTPIVSTTHRSVDSWLPHHGKADILCESEVRRSLRAG